MDPDKKALKRARKQKQRERLEASIPMSRSDLKDLFDWLDRDGAPPCDHTLRETTEFLKGRNLDPARIIPWLNEYGGYCDCEVIYNVEQEFGPLVGR
jgi:hypothetical protein